ncbi:MAG: hypothetical protein MPK62_01395 [Alphaproteobacteria bacterium]|nr:hypothetical protein [Alphaproteobacteria bacterium]
MASFMSPSRGRSRSRTVTDGSSVFNDTVQNEMTVVFTNSRAMKRRMSEILATNAAKGQSRFMIREIERLSEKISILSSNVYDHEAKSRP